MKMQLSWSAWMSYYASLKLGAPARRTRAAMARAKVQLGQSMRFVVSRPCNYGGIGVTDEYIVSHYFKKLPAGMAFMATRCHPLGRGFCADARHGGRVCLSAGAAIFSRISPCPWASAHGFLH